MRIAKLFCLILLLASGLHAQSVPPATSFTGKPLRSTRPGVSILPLAWVHGGLGGTGKDVTVAFLYLKDGSSGEQVKMPAVTVPLSSAGDFHGAYADIVQLRGIYPGQQIRLSAKVDNGAEIPPDVLDDVPLSPVAAGGELPAAGGYAMTSVYDPVLGPKQFTYEDLWTVAMQVAGKGASRTVTVSYFGPPGSFVSIPLPLGDGSFSGLARAVGEDGKPVESRNSVRFAGVFLPVDDGVSPRGSLNYPVLSQVWVSGTDAWPLTDAVGTSETVWLASSDRTKSGLVLGTAHMVTPGAAGARAQALLQDRGVVSASVGTVSFGTTAMPNDPLFPDQYPYPIKTGLLCCTNGANPLLNDAWGVANADGNGVTVAVMDSGVVGNHPDLNGKILWGHNSLPWPWWIDWLRRLLPANWQINTGDVRGHGTGVTGVITANRNNNQGVAGVALSPQVIPVRIMNQYMSISTAAQLDGMLWLLDNDLADVVNLSYRSEEADPNVVVAIRRLIQGGRVVVAGTGNDHIDVAFAPSSLPDVIGVGASDRNNGPADYSNYSRVMDLVAPGGDDVEELPVCWKAGALCNTPLIGFPNYCLVQGTSYAAPYVSGIVTMFLTVNPNLRRTDINCTGNPRACVARVAATLSTTGQVINTAGLWGPTLTQARLVDAYAAMTTAPAAAFPAPANLAATACAGGNCILPGLQLTFNLIAGPPANYVLQGYVLYRNGEFLRAPGSADPLPIAGSPFNDTTLPQTGGVPQTGRYEYTLIALYQHNNGTYARSFSSNVVTVNCNAAGCA